MDLDREPTDYESHEDEQEDAQDLPAPGHGIAERAEQGLQTGAGALPYADQLQRAFGRHDISNIRAHVGGDATEAAFSIGANAYANGDHVVFGVAPDLRLAAHEAAHVVQQRAGHGPQGGVGQVGDAYEQHADEVAARVVSGGSAEDLLDRMAPGASRGSAPKRGVQMEKGLVQGDACVVGTKTGRIESVAGMFYMVLLDGEAKARKFMEAEVSKPVAKPTSGKKWTPPKSQDAPKEVPKQVGVVVPTLDKEGVPVKAGEPILCSHLPEMNLVERVDGGDVYIKIVKTGEIVKASRFDVKHPTAEDHKKRELWVGDHCKCPLRGGYDTSYTVLALSEESCTIQKEGDEPMVVERWMVLRDWAQPFKAPKKEGNHRLITDELAGKEALEKGSPSTWMAKIGKVGDGKELTTPGYSGEKFEETARIDVTTKVTGDGITIDFTVKSNPGYMCERIYPEKHEKSKKHEIMDLVPIYLERANDDYIEVITVLEPTNDKNVCTGRVDYTWEWLAKGLKIDTTGLQKDAIIEAVKERQLGVKAQWIAEVAGKNNQNHTSGGVNQKGGSGKVRFEKQQNTAKLAQSEETSRNVEWNMGERLNEGRPVFDAFPEIMQAGKELATTLEAESEFRVEPARFDKVVAQMDILSSTKDYWSHFGILGMTKSDPKNYTDTYYDIAGTEKNDNSLLQKGVVLRERHVKGDPEDTFLFAVKGRSFAQDESEDSERIRLAAQINMNRAKVLDDGGKGSVPSVQGGKELDRLVRDTSIDNAFGRTLDHALSDGKNLDHGGTAMSTLMGDKGHIRPALLIESVRHKFMMNLAGGTAIDFSADAATGFQLDPETGAKKPLEGKAQPIVHSFEFGVGHPSLNASSTQGGSSKTESTEVRPYHVPRDLQNPDLFEKPDFTQFQGLRDQVIKEALIDKGEKLEHGGNKAQVLAKKLKMIPE